METCATVSSGRDDALGKLQMQLVTQLAESESDLQKTKQQGHRYVVRRFETHAVEQSKLKIQLDSCKVFSLLALLVQKYKCWHLRSKALLVKSPRSPRITTDEPEDLHATGSPCTYGLLPLLVQQHKYWHLRSCVPVISYGPGVSDKSEWENEGRDRENEGRDRESAESGVSICTSVLRYRTHVSVFVLLYMSPYLYCQCHSTCTVCMSQYKSTNTDTRGAVYPFKKLSAAKEHAKTYVKTLITQYDAELKKCITEITFDKTLGCKSSETAGGVTPGGVTPGGVTG